MWYKFFCTLCMDHNSLYIAGSYIVVMTTLIMNFIIIHYQGK